MALYHGIFLDNNPLVVLKLELDNETSIFKKQYIICNINVAAFKKKTIYLTFMIIGMVYL